ncbi:MAG: response regulator, partial [Methyloceanibacter sp.]|uniref:response regulator n=1 Tax=Methyloceanibacter sp. TaxID=1965321 RepID=UPI003C6BD437
MSKSVLIVEDTASTGILYQSWLKKAGISARCVEDGASAMAELRKGSYRLMLLDLQLPDINGLEILGTLREDDVP